MTRSHVPADLIDALPRRTTFSSIDRAVIVAAVEQNLAGSGMFRKTARLLAVRMPGAFEVETEHGRIGGEPGDWIATNHPDDDASSDVWPISNERLSQSYEVIVKEPEPTLIADADVDDLADILNSIIANLRWPDGRGANRHHSIAITHIEEAVLRLGGELRD